MCGLLWVYSWRTKTISPWSSEATTCFTSDGDSFWYSFSISDTNSVSIGMGRENGGLRGELCCTSLCATNCWIGYSSLPEAEKINSTDKLCTFPCTTEDESVVVASEDRGTTSSSQESKLNCSMTSECTSTCAINVRYLGSQLQHQARGQGTVRDFFGHILQSKTEWI